jgi:hypothetical protein
MAEFQREGLYRIVDIPKIIRALQNNPGWIKGTTPSNFFVNKGGYSCRHEAIPLRLTKREKALWG